MEQREIKVYSTLNQDFIRVTTNASTWGELKSLPEVSKLLTSDMQGLIKSTKVTLTHNDASLPAEPFTLFLLPQKSKGGGSVEPEAVESMGNLLQDLDDTIGNLLEISKELKEIFDKDITSEVDSLKAEAEKIKEELGI